MNRSSLASPTQTERLNLTKSPVGSIVTSLHLEDFDRDIVKPARQSLTTRGTPRTAARESALTAVPSPPAGCELWLCSLDDDTHAFVAMAASLSVPERARAARFG